MLHALKFETQNYQFGSALKLGQMNSMSSYSLIEFQKRKIIMFNVFQSSSPRLYCLIIHNLPRYMSCSLKLCHKTVQYYLHLLHKH